ncbi:hypothetical protein F4678DRAFT_448332 [Xylaria arbuscula]|nr:hypothetical protein F4678DRAFT_448332 [Xylaria arbuscula]
MPLVVYGFWPSKNCSPKQYTHLSVVLVLGLLLKGSDGAVSHNSYLGHAHKCVSLLYHRVVLCWRWRSDKRMGQKMGVYANGRWYRTSQMMANRELHGPVRSCLTRVLALPLVSRS